MEQTEEEIKKELDTIEKQLDKKPECGKLRAKAKALREKAKAKSKGAAADFKRFAFKGNIIDLAIAVIIGTAFGKIVSSLVADIVMPAIAMIFGEVDFTDLVAGGIRYGAFIQTIVEFFLIALSIFLVFKVVMMFRARAEKKRIKNALPPAPPALTKTEELLTDIKDLLSKDKDKSKT